MINCLLDQPRSVLLAILIEWTDVRAVTRLDSACCNQQLRPHLLEALRSVGTVFEHTPYFRSGSSRRHSSRREVLRWLVRRNVKVRKFSIESDVATQGASDPLLTSYFVMAGTAMHSLSIAFLEYGPAAALHFATQHCTNLQSFRLAYCETKGSSAPLTAFLKAVGATLQKLEFDSIKIPPLRSNFQLSALLSLNVSNCSFPVRTMCHVICGCPNLESLLCSDLQRKNDVLLALAASCPRLRLLSYSLADPRSAAGLEAVVHGCPLLEVVDLHDDYLYCDIVSFWNEHTQLVTQHCAHLRALRIMAHGVGSVMSATAAAQRAPDLRHLAILSLKSALDTPLLTLAQGCGQLESLDLSGLDQRISQQALQTLVGALGRVEELVLNKVYVSDAVLGDIATHCANLRTLQLGHASGFTEVGMSALMQGGEALTALCVGHNCRALSPALRAAWQERRPRLTFYTYDGSSRPPSYWDFAPAVTGVY